MASDQEIHSRRGRTLTDLDAKNITRVEELSYDLKIKEVMVKDVKAVSPQWTMREVLSLLRSLQISGTPVIEDGRLVGIISLDDLLRALTHQNLDASVSEYMSRKVLSVGAYESVIKAIQTFTQMKVGRLPVVDETGQLVGIITKGDVTRGILEALQRDYQTEEVRRYRASHLFEDINSDRTSLILRYHIKAGDLANGGKASSDIKRALVRLGASPQIARRCGIAVYEAEINIIIHTTKGGQIRIEIEPQRIIMRITDDGPGIPDIDLAMQAGYSTATEAIREMGFGAGMGLMNIKKSVDEMHLESTVGKGTKLELVIYLPAEENLRKPSYFQEEIG
jgi:CBS domain-containing protein/anti-sigma regulatory factor (Ser/Thr protein kinase)